MLNKITTRKGLPQDLNELQQLSIDTVFTVCSSDYDTNQIRAWTFNLENDKRWREMISQQFVLVAQIENKILGFVTLENGKYIDFFYIHKDYQRQGIAHQLYIDIEKEAIRKKQTKLISYVSKTAIPFFVEIGFKVLYEQTVDLKKVSLTNFKMEKILHQ